MKHIESIRASEGERTMMELPKEPRFYPDESKIHKIMKTNLSDGEIDIRLKYPDAEIINRMAATTIDMGIKMYLFKLIGMTGNKDNLEEWFREVGKPTAELLIKIQTQLLKEIEPDYGKYMSFIKDEEDMRNFLQLPKDLTE